MSAPVRWVTAFCVAVLTHAISFALIASWLDVPRQAASPAALTLLLETLAIPSPPEPQPPRDPLFFAHDSVPEPPAPEPSPLREPVSAVPEPIPLTLPEQSPFPEPAPRSSPASPASFDLPDTRPFVPALHVPPDAPDTGLPNPADAKTHGPALLSSIRPRYPMGSRFRGEEGVVRVWVRVDERGKPVAVTVRIASGYRALDMAAVAAARRARFVPPDPDAPPEAFETELSIRFRLTD